MCPSEVQLMRQEINQCHQEAFVRSGVLAGSSGNPGGQQSMTGNNVGGTNDMGKCCLELKPIFTTFVVKTSANHHIFATSLLHLCQQQLHHVTH